MALDFLMIGAQKSGTSFIEDCLRDHPAVRMPIDEIPIFESPDYEECDPEALKFASLASPGCLSGIKRPSYLGMSEVPDRIKQHAPDAKLILILRNPVQRAISAYFHYVGNGFIPFADLETGMSRILDGKYRENYPAAPQILEFGYYARHLRTYLELFSRDRIFIMLHDEIVEDKYAALRKVYAFLGIDVNHVPKAIDTRPQAVVYHPFRVRVNRQIRKLSYRLNPKRTRLFPTRERPFEKLLARTLTWIDVRILEPMLGNRKPVPSRVLMSRLEELYRADISDLESLLNRSLPEWKPKNNP